MRSSMPDFGAGVISNAVIVRLLLMGCWKRVHGHCCTGPRTADTNLLMGTRQSIYSFYLVFSFCLHNSQLSFPELCVCSSAVADESNDADSAFR